jgi:hypothetical protein
MPWTIVEARTRFAEFVRAAEGSPQPVERHGRLVGVMIAPELYEAFLAWQRERQSRSVADAFRELAALSDDEALVLPPRRNRSNSFEKP